MKAVTNTLSVNVTSQKLKEKKKQETNKKIMKNKEKKKSHKTKTNIMIQMCKI